MKKRICGRKVFGFIFIEITLIIFFLVILFYKPELLSSLGKDIIGYMVAVVLLLVGGNSADKLIKSVFYKPGLNDNFNTQETK